MKHATVILSGLWLTLGLAYAQAPTQSAPQRQGAAAAADEGPTEVVQEAAQGMLLTTSFYWGRDKKSREWSKKFFAVRARCRRWCMPASIPRSRSRP